MCQDSVCVRQYSSRGKQYVVAALSDGAGSAAKSEYGSKALVEGITEHIISFFDSLVALVSKDNLSFRTEIIEAANSILEKTSEDQNCTIKDLASTLMFVAADQKNVIYFHVGDGVIIMRKGDAFSVISKPYNGEYANETVFVSSHGAADDAHAGIFELSGNIDSFFLMSDGPEPVFYSKRDEKPWSLQLLSFVDNKCIMIPDDENRRNLFVKYVLEERCRPYSPDDLSLIILSRVKTLTKEERIQRRHQKRLNVAKRKKASA